METKSFALSEVKAAGAKGEFEALVSVVDNIDRVGDRVLQGAFRKAIDEQPPPPVVWFHQWNIPPIGETLDWAEQAGKGLAIKGRLFVDDDDHHEYARMVYTAMKSREGRAPALRQFSFAYDVEEADTTFEKSGERVRELKALFPIHEVGPCLRGVNEATGLISAPKAQTPLFESNTTGIFVPSTWPGTAANSGYTVTVEPKASSAPAPTPNPAPTPEPGPTAPTPVPPAPPAPAPTPAAAPAAEAKSIPTWRFPPQHATHPTGSGGQS